MGAHQVSGLHCFLPLGRMLKIWCVFLSLILGFPSIGQAMPNFVNPLSCMSLLLSKAADSRNRSEGRFQETVEVIRAAGAVELLRPLDEKKIEVIYKGTRMPWQSMVSGRQNWRGVLSLTVRALDFKDTKEKQMAIWQTAMALFELETRSNIWSLRSMLTPDDQRRFDLSMSASDENLGYFLIEQPSEWRDLQLKKIEILEVELYALFNKLDQLKPEDLLPKNDPGRYWIARSIYGGDASRAVAPNQADFESWKKSAELPSQAARHGRSLIFNYYMNFMKRAVVLTLLAQVAIATPEFQSVPSYLDAMFSAKQVTHELNSTPGRSDELKARVSLEAERLKKEIHRQKQKAKTDRDLIVSLEQELKDLYDLYPWLAHGRK